MKALAAAAAVGLGGKLIVQVATIGVGGNLVEACAAAPDANAYFTLTPCVGTAQPGPPPACNTPNLTFFIDGGVNDMMLARCGTLDCHGQIGRPLRLLGHDSLRLPPDGSPTQDPTAATTDQERLDDFDSIISLEPEEMIKVVLGEDNADPNQLLLIRKPTGQVVHKGGDNVDYPPPVFEPSSEGLTCLYCWLQPGAQQCVGQDIPGACASATAFSVGDGG